jgi:hypothetical protein
MIIRKLPVRERVERVAARIDRGVYTHAVSMYAGVGAILFDEYRMADDLGLSNDALRALLNTTPREGSSGWTLPRCPTSEEVRTAADKIEVYLTSK